MSDYFYRRANNMCIYTLLLYQYLSISGIYLSKKGNITLFNRNLFALNKTKGVSYGT